MKTKTGLIVTIAALLAGCATAGTNDLFLTVSNTEFVRRVAAITNNEAKITLLNTASNALNAVVTGLVVTVSNLSTSGGASIPVLSNRVDQVEDDLAASIGSYSNSYLICSGTWKGSGYNYSYAGLTNGRPAYTLNLGTNGSDSVYCNGTNWVAVQSVTGGLFFDESDPLIPHHQSATLATNSIPPTVLARNLTNEYSSGSMYLRFISGAEAILQTNLQEQFTANRFTAASLSGDLGNSRYRIISGSGDSAGWYDYDSTDATGRPVYKKLGGAETNTVWWDDGYGGQWMVDYDTGNGWESTYLREGPDPGMIPPTVGVSGDSYISEFVPQKTMPCFIVYTNANGPTGSFYTNGDGNNLPVLYKRYAD